MNAKSPRYAYRMPKSFKMLTLPRNFRDGRRQGGLPSWPVRLFANNAVFEIDRIVIDTSDDEMVYLYTNRLLQAIESISPESPTIDTRSWNGHLFYEFHSAMRRGVEHIEMGVAQLPRDDYLEEGR